MTTYSMIVLGIACPVALLIIVLLINRWNKKRLVESMTEDVEEWIAGYKRQMTGGNRFVINREILQESFPEYKPDVVNKVWREMVASQVVQEDPMDKQLIVRP